MPQEWTEGRLNELSSKVDRGLGSVGTEIHGLRQEMRAEFTAVRAEMSGMRTEINGMRTEITGRFDSLQRTMIQAMVALTAAILAGFAGIFALLAAAL